MRNIKHIKHLWARAGFGLRFEDLKELENIPVKHAVTQLLNAAVWSKMPATAPIMARLIIF